MSKPGQQTGAVVGGNITPVLLALTVSTAFFCRLTLSSLQEPLRAGLNLTDSQVALVQGLAMALAAVLGAIPVGLLVDRTNRARLLSVFLLLNFVGTVTTALSADFAELFVSRAVIGFSTGAVAITALSLFGDLFPRSQRGRGGMLMGVAQILGLAIAFPAGGSLVARFHSSDGWRAATLVMSVPLLAAFLLSFVIREPKRMETAVERPTLARSFGELWNFRAVFAPLLVGVIMAGGAGGAILVWGVPALSRSFGVSTGEGDTIMGVALMIGGLFGPIIGGFAVDRCLKAIDGGAALAMGLLAACGAVSVLLGLFALSPGVVFASVCLTAFLLVGGVIVSASHALMTVLLPNEIRGFSMAVLSVAQVLLDTGLAPSLVIVAAASIGGASRVGAGLAIVCAAAGVNSAAAFLFGREHLKRSPTAGRLAAAVADPLI